MGSMTNRNACKGAWVLVLVVLVGGQLGIAADDDQPGRRQSTPDLSGVSSDERRMIAENHDIAFWIRQVGEQWSRQAYNTVCLPHLPQLGKDLNCRTTSTAHA